MTPNCKGYSCSSLPVLGFFKAIIDGTQVAKHVTKCSGSVNNNCHHIHTEMILRQGTNAVSHALDKQTGISHMYKRGPAEQSFLLQIAESWVYVPWHRIMARGSVVALP